MDSNIQNNVFQIINRLTHIEFSSLQLNDIKKLAIFMNISHQNKRKDALIEDIARTLSQLILRSPNSFNGLQNTFPMITYDLNYVYTDSHIRKIIDNYQEAIKNPAFYNHNQPLMQYPTAEYYPYMGLFDPHFIPQVSRESINRINQIPHTFPPPQHKRIDIKPCICGVGIQNEPEHTYVTCINSDCARRVHEHCAKVKIGTEQAKLYECFDCVLKYCDPLHEVIDVLKAPYRLDTKQHHFNVEPPQVKHLENSENVGVEIRCIRLEEKVIEQTWPHHGELFLNSRRELEFKPLQQNSSLKKRKDEKLFTRNYRAGWNTLDVKFFPKNDFQKGKNPETETYIIGIYLVRKLSPEELVKKVQTLNKRSKEECKKRIVEQFGASDIQIDKLSYTLNCVLDFQPLKIPAKGAHCKHVNCFSLENFISVLYKNNQRKWLCPICKTKSYTIIVDSYFQEILQAAEELDVMNSDNAEVIFDNCGEYTFSGKEKEMQKVKEQRVKMENITNAKGGDAKPKPELARNASKRAEESITIILDSEDDEPPAPPVEEHKKMSVEPPKVNDMVPETQFSNEQLLDTGAMDGMCIAQDIKMGDARMNGLNTPKKSEASKELVINSTPRVMDSIDHEISEVSSVMEIEIPSENKSVSQSGRTATDRFPASIKEIASGPLHVLLSDPSTKLNPEVTDDLTRHAYPEIYNSLQVGKDDKEDIALKKSFYNSEIEFHIDEGVKDLEPIEIEPEPIQIERKQVLKQLSDDSGSLVQMTSNIKEALTELLKYSDKDGELLSIEQFQNHDARKTKRPKNYALTGKKKLIRLFYKYFQEKLKNKNFGEKKGIPKKGRAEKGSSKEREKDKVSFETESTRDVSYENREPAVGEAISNGSPQLNGKEKLAMPVPAKPQLGKENGVHLNNPNLHTSNLSVHVSNPIMHANNPSVHTSNSNGFGPLVSKASSDSGTLKQKGAFSDPICLD